jgi:hypothetical protein
LKELIKSRNEFFKEGTNISELFMNEIISQRNTFYYEKKDNKETFRMGIVFFIVTIFADIGIHYL